VRNVAHTGQLPLLHHGLSGLLKNHSGRETTRISTYTHTVK
jgi:hypothetical protein